MATKTNKTIVMAGDFNCPDINWEHLTVKSGSEKEVQQQLIETTTSASLTQIHDQPTRADNMLDLVFTSNPSHIKTSVSVPGISNHDIVITNMEIKPHYQKTTTRKGYIYSKANWDNLNNALEDLTKTIVDMYKKGNNIHELWETFKVELLKHLDECIPSRNIKSKHSVPWLKHRERKLLKKKKILYRQAKKTKKWTNYRHFQKECKRTLRSADGITSIPTY